MSPHVPALAVSFVSAPLTQLPFRDRLTNETVPNLISTDAVASAGVGDDLRASNLKSAVLLVGLRSIVGLGLLLAVYEVLGNLPVAEANPFPHEQDVLLLLVSLFFGLLFAPNRALLDNALGGVSGGFQTQKSAHRVPSASGLAHSRQGIQTGTEERTAVSHAFETADGLGSLASMIAQERGTSSTVHFPSCVTCVLHFAQMRPSAGGRLRCTWPPLVESHLLGRGMYCGLFPFDASSGALCNRG